jgi:nitrogen fixation/metabolism regulation signal transduction histidine kinase
MWIVEEEQQQLLIELETLAASASADSAGALAASATSFDILFANDSILRQPMPATADLDRLISEFAEPGGDHAVGRMVAGGQLLAWACVRRGTIEVCGGRILPQRYFRLADQVIEGRNRFRSLSKTLLPIGQDLLLKIAGALAAISLVLSLLAAQMLSYGLSAPLDKLVEATKRIRRGDLNYRIPAGSRDEIGALIANFNQMTADLERTTRELVTAEREMTWRETARTIAHEIKNLLTPVNVALYKIKRMLGDSRQIDAELSRSLAVLSLEVDAVADLARQFSLFAHPPKLILAEVDLRDLVAESLAIHERRASHHDVSVSVADAAARLRADRDLLRRALSNLIKNSLEATPYGGAITISAALKDGGTEIVVQDDGPGADVAIDLTLPYITTKKSGTGLGLAIVKRICEAHGWRLSYENAGGGFRVIITVPGKDE